MPDLLAARSQMGISLAFHIVFAVIGIAMPVLMVVAERRWQVTGHAIYLDLAKLWAKGTAIVFAFFAEAIFLGIYLYGWDRISRRAHLWAGVAVAASGMASGIFVVIANAWMNAPTGFALANGQLVNVDPLAAMANAAAPSQTL